MATADCTARLAEGSINAPSPLNPLIENHRDDTLANVASVLSFLERVHSDLADGAPAGMTSDQHRGLSLMIGCIRGAVAYELCRAECEVQP